LFKETSKTCTIPVQPLGITEIVVFCALRAQQTAGVKYAVKAFKARKQGSCSTPRVEYADENQYIYFT